MLLWDCFRDLRDTAAAIGNSASRPVWVRRASLLTYLSAPADRAARPRLSAAPLNGGNLDDDHFEPPLIEAAFFRSTVMAGRQAR